MYLLLGNKVGEVELFNNSRLFAMFVWTYKTAVGKVDAPNGQMW